jgi:peptidoglycan hydrolase-like protein with peptidoglycan-binding domain
VALGDDIKIDGIYRIETLNAIKDFEEKNNLLVDGFIDPLTLELMFK